MRELQQKKRRQPRVARESPRREPAYYQNSLPRCEMTSNVSSADDWDDGNWEDCPLPDEEEATISYEYDKNEDDDAHEIANCEHLPNEVLEEIFQYVRNNETEDYFLNRDHGIQDKFYDHDTVLKNKRDLWLYRMSFMDMLDGRHTLL